MTGRWRQVLPPLPWLIVWIVIYSATFLLDIGKTVGFEVKVPGRGFDIRWLLLSMSACMHGLFRVTLFHPATNRKYRNWLALTPWSWNKPLPMGPVHLIWVDCVVVILLMFLAFMERFFEPIWFEIEQAKIFFHFTIPALLFLFFYLINLVRALFICKQKTIVLIFLFGLPFTFYPFQGLYVMLGILILLYGACLWCIRIYLKEFPWNSTFWENDPVGELREMTVRRGLIGWPHRMLNVEYPFRIPPGRAFIFSLLATWWLHALSSASAGEWNHSFIILTAFILVLFRLLIYIVDHFPPIGFIGRIATRRWVIPGYDRVFVAPICAMTTGLLAPYLFNATGLNPQWSYEITFFLIVFMIFAMGPTMREWNLTGQHRLHRPIVEQQSRPRKSTSSDDALFSFFRKDTNR